MLFDGGKLIVEAMPETDKDVLDFIVESIRAYQEYNDAGQPKESRIAVIEKVSGYIGENQPGSSAFKFGRSTGFLFGIIMALNFRIENPTPQRWIKMLGLGSREHFPKPDRSNQAEYAAWQRKESESKRVWKNKLKARAQELYPAQKVTLKTCDALLLLEYAKIPAGTVPPKPAGQTELPF